MSTLPRRRALKLLAGGAAAGVLAGCTGHSGGGPSGGPSTSTGISTSTGPSSGSPTAADWRALAAGLAGSLVLPDSSGFATAHQLYDPRWDSIAPVAVLRAANSGDIVEAVRFARQHGLRLAPRGGGHSYLGASSVAGGLVVDTRALDAVSYDAATSTATIGAGAQLIDVYAALARHDRGVPAGTCPTVGVAGLTQGGGFGVFDRAYGLTCDAVVEMDVITADAEAKTIDVKRDPDLFWAMRGGGGGDFAVVTALRTSTFAAGDVGRWSARWSWSHAEQAIVGWQRFVAGASDNAWANAHLDVLPGDQRGVVVIGVSLRGRSPSADLHACVAQVGVEPSSTSVSTHSHLDTVLSLAGCSELGQSECHLPPQGRFARESFVAGSSVPAAWLSGAGAGRLVAAVSDSSEWSGERHAVCDPLGGAIARTSAGTNAFPWRGSPFTVQWYANLPLSHPQADVAAAGRWVAAARTRMALDAPGAYINYPSSDIADPAVYHGGAYARLRQVKGSYDPSHLFRPPAGVAG